MNKTVNYNLIGIRYNAKEQTVLVDGKIYTASEFLEAILEDNQNLDMVVTVRGAN